MLPVPTQPAASLLVADSVPLLRHGLLQALSHRFVGHHVQEVGTADELRQQLADLRPALIVTSLTLPGGLPEPGELLPTLRQWHPGVAVLVLTDPVSTTEAVQLRLLRQGVNCLLPRTAPVEEVCEAVDLVLMRGRYYNEQVLSLLQGQLDRPARLARPITRFSSRQLEVLRLIAEDYSNEKIAELLCTSVRTVEYHRSQMLQKAGTRTTLGLVLFALREGMLSNKKLLEVPVTA